MNYRTALESFYPEAKYRFLTPKWNDYNDIEWVSTPIPQAELQEKWDDLNYELELSRWRQHRKAQFSDFFEMFRLLYLDQKNGTTQFSDYVDNILNNLPPRPTR